LIRRLQSESQLQHKSAAPPAAAPLPPPAQSTTHGKMAYASGAVYEGEFKDGKANGQGTMTYADGRRESGTWRDGKFVG
jgi:hypothetical protein